MQLYVQCVCFYPLLFLPPTRPYYLSPTLLPPAVLIFHPFLDPTHLQVRDIGMASPDLLQLVENCPQGGETLIMRMLHILTEGGN